MTDWPILYSFRRCPYAMRARMALLVSGQRCMLREVLLRDKPEAMIAASPKGTVPVLVLADGAVIDESLDVMRWALAQSDPEGWLEPDVSECTGLVETNDGPFKHHLDRYKYATRYDSDPVEHRAAASALLNALEERLQARAQLLGDARSFADIALFPFIRQFAATDSTWFDAQPWAALRNWLDAHIGSALFKSAMGKFQPWAPGDPEIIWPADGARSDL
ncbi:glutathione S-transferase [Parasphingopyxis sp.]|uniref:glutathione S-transferase n=1 Tax=Parasphingopyxis sp. TaxID=1920299 RepID=UPI0026155DED|nr:glutathione S-transferase [Parasphingopyxis sp.]